MKRLILATIKNSTERDILLPLFKGSWKAVVSHEEFYNLRCGLKISMGSFVYLDEVDIAIGECVLSVLAFKRAYELGQRQQFKG